MAIDPSTETVLSFAQASREVPAVDGRQPSPASVYRWARQGLLCGNGRIRLEAGRIGRRYVTTKEALDRFFRAMAEAEERRATPERTAPTADREHATTPAARRHAIDEANARLAEAGI